MTLLDNSRIRFNERDPVLAELRPVCDREGGKTAAMSELSRIVRRMIWSSAVCAVLLLAGALGSSSVLAQSATPAPQEEARPEAANEIAANGITADQVNAVARELWCPLCSGVRLDSCELKACIQMKDVIALKLAEGEDTEAIKAYFVEQYGPQVLGEPPRQGFNWLAWILPVVAAAVGGGFFWRMTRRMVQAQPAAVSDAAARRPETEEDYERKLEEELAKYG